MTAHEPESQDVRALLGMHTAAARFIVAFYALTYTVLAVTSTEGVRSMWPIAATVVLMTVGAFLLIVVPGDPLPVPAAIALAATGPIAVALVFPVLPVPVASPLQTWPLGAATALYTFMCVRGGTAWAWAGSIGMIGACVVWAAATGQGAVHGIAISIINLAPLLMSTFFAYTIRPAATAIFQLRRQSTTRTEATAAASAVLAERDAQLRRLDALARPLLERIASGESLAAEQRLACQLLEAHLRDTLRAPALARPAVAAAARAARGRGVDVVLLDDRGMDGTDAGVQELLVASVADRLDAVAAGSVTARILPPGRNALATVLVNSGGELQQVEFGHDGRPMSPEPTAAAVH